ncbi:hypothetical protein FSP39_008104 [Pinctada imbricata]|uniref:Uncharacterized protein n=1 Tax=Pinctada imbricata TaxID=66713 RepID=A0AA88Y845_PINIB|nr:hypothetical protein FSP39_008104 [Pinctada imbricata]
MGNIVNTIMKLVLAVSRPDTLRTLGVGAIFITLLHFIIKFEQVKEYGDFYNLYIPIEEEFVPLGISSPEDFPTSGPYRIPKIIHQTWKNRNIPSKFSKWVKSWVKNHPDWQYYLWTDDSARKLIRERHPHLLDVFNGYEDGIRRADSLRYIILYEFGGVYADMDMESLKPLDPFARKYACFLGQEPYEHPILDGGYEGLVINALMASRAKHPYMKLLMENLPKYQNMWSVMDSTGPHFVTLHFRDFNKNHPQPADHINGTYLAPSEYFFPTVDPSKYFWFNAQCGKFMKLKPIQQKACKSLKVNKLKKKPLSFSYTDHHWEHTYIDFRLSLKGPVDIKHLVPHAVIY